jgi:hypothetical protein
MILTVIRKLYCNSGRREEHRGKPFPESYDPYVLKTVFLMVTEGGQFSTQT